jgi:hypothetical protein
VDWNFKRAGDPYLGRPNRGVLGARAKEKKSSGRRGLPVRALLSEAVWERLVRPMRPDPTTLGHLPHSTRTGEGRRAGGDRDRGGSPERRRRRGGCPGGVGGASRPPPTSSTSGEARNCWEHAVAGAVACEDDIAGELEIWRERTGEYVYEVSGDGVSLFSKEGWPFIGRSSGHRE